MWLSICSKVSEYVNVSVCVGLCVGLAILLHLCYQKIKTIKFNMWITTYIYKAMITSH